MTSVAGLRGQRSLSQRAAVADERSRNLDEERGRLALELERLRAQPVVAHIGEIAIGGVAHPDHGNLVLERM
jgi:hypothetical protein